MIFDLFSYRSRRDRLQQDGKRQNSSVCLADTSHTQSRSIWNIRLGSYANTVGEDQSNDVSSKIILTSSTLNSELAFQIADQFRAFGSPIGLRDAVIVGGLDAIDQGVALQSRPHVVIATPGRLADFISHSQGGQYFSKYEPLKHDTMARHLMI